MRLFELFSNIVETGELTPKSLGIKLDLGHTVHM